MWYFAYGSNLNTRAVAQWCEHYDLRPPIMTTSRPAILENHRLCFSIYSEYWGGGIADIIYDPGKSVAGALYDLSEQDLRTLDRKVGRKLDSDGHEIGAYRRINVSVTPIGKGQPVKAVTYQGLRGDCGHIPPTRHYMDLVLQGAYMHGLSMMWISYLQSFPTQSAVRLPRPPTPKP